MPAVIVPRPLDPLLKTFITVIPHLERHSTMLLNTERLLISISPSVIPDHRIFWSLQCQWKQINFPAVMLDSNISGGSVVPG